MYNEVHFPRVLGGECAGTIAAIGDGVEALASLGKVFNLPTILTSSFSDGSNDQYRTEITAMYPDYPILNRTMMSAWDDPKFVSAIVTYTTTERK